MPIIFNLIRHKHIHYQGLFFFIILSLSIHPLQAQDHILNPPTATQKRNISQRNYRQAIQLFYHGDFEASLQKHLTNIKHDPLFFDSYYEAIALLRESSRNKEAVSIAEQLFHLSPEPEKVIELYFITLVQSNQLQKARTIEEQLPIQVTHHETLFYQGFLSYRLREYTVAIALFEQALLHDPHFAAAAFFIGLTYQAENLHQRAVEAFSRTLNIEPNFTSALYPLAISQLALGKKYDALTNLRRARNLLPRSQRIQKKIAEIEATLPKNTAPSSNQQQDNRKKNITLPSIKHNAPMKDGIIPIRIGLVEDIRQLQVKTSPHYYIQDHNRTILYKSSNSELLTIQALDNTITIYDENKTLILTSASSLFIGYDSNQASTAVFDIINGAGYYFSSVVTRYYRGQLELLPRSHNRLSLINHLNLEEYLYSVVPSEMPAYWPEEALKAQAVAARTYALATMGTYNSRGFDLLSSVASQAYTGLAGEHERTTKAVNDTAGMVLYSKTNQDLMVTYYSANHGGYSEYGHSVWNHARANEHVAVADIKENNKRKEFLPLHQLQFWLKERPLTHSSWPKHYSSFAFRSAVWIDNEDMQARILSRRNIEMGSIISLATKNRGISGRVSVIEVKGERETHTIHQDIIRSSLGGLRSNLFTIESIHFNSDHPEYFIIYTAGWGHGVGLDQSGSAGMAADGYSWKQILKHYYPNGQLKKYHKLS
ncbi:SpoIID/LytB domain-containing protein [Entomospira nematocerorum]|uniref:SpoIID/LytB domain-containing protein n=1 Tax=Entomospira nematocerorum TaxID=2719987 RepID=A0A968GEP1_9SPIO|nr:SpoIID/LytB domain-containing protein [Entomospira nematocera]NIZ46376.1 SpoIID/LytB domain-containing protein [Entomospira nematocera]WDI33819.1 SpoIID/LytB domain-containing protein [Entomospira nematocera]